jgi:hypothetical protein
MATGQAAGVCAALAASSGARPREVPHQRVQTELLRQGADLGDIPSGDGAPVAAGVGRRVGPTTS